MGSKQSFQLKVPRLRYLTLASPCVSVGPLKSPAGTAAIVTAPARAAWQSLCAGSSWDCAPSQLHAAAAALLAALKPTSLEVTEDDALNYTSLQRRCNQKTILNS